MHTRGAEAATTLADGQPDGAPKQHKADYSSSAQAMRLAWYKHATVSLQSHGSQPSLGVFDRNEWECFLDGVRKGEFDDAPEE